jgi:hypothetical protein
MADTRGRKASSLVVAHLAEAQELARALHKQLRPAHPRRRRVGVIDRRTHAGQRGRVVPGILAYVPRDPLRRVRADAARFPRPGSLRAADAGGVGLSEVIELHARMLAPGATR